MTAVPARHLDPIQPAARRPAGATISASLRGQALLCLAIVVIAAIVSNVWR